MKVEKLAGRGGSAFITANGRSRRLKALAHWIARGATSQEAQSEPPSPGESLQSPALPLSLHLSLSVFLGGFNTACFVIYHGFFSAFFDCGELHAIPAHSETLWRHSDAEICEAADSPSFAVLRVSENARRGRKLADHVNSLTKRQTSSYSRVVVKIFTLREIFRLTTPRAWT